MPKPAIETLETSKMRWQPIKEVPGTSEKMLSRDDISGSYTRLVLFDLNTSTDDQGILAHDFWEEVYIIRGWVQDKRTGIKYTEGVYTCRPPRTKHGPFYSKDGCMLYETRYYPERYQAGKKD